MTIGCQGDSTYLAILPFLISGNISKVCVESSACILPVGRKICPFTGTLDATSTTFGIMFHVRKGKWIVRVIYVLFFVQCMIHYYSFLDLLLTRTPVRLGRIRRQGETFRAVIF